MLLSSLPYPALVAFHRIWWHEEEEWFAGVVKKVSKQEDRFYVLYDDGDKDWEELNHLV